ncbi:uncharacterized protein LOC124595402 [Schistocerca americana]|uniref:uncharacterized protein LOC124595402 n=1 Tax=Schistocerca americana TaxID=7009 RepID=UPI001F4F41CB|nr:uncharacterized protein LOC124595402 [Schistocerca americana]XP_047108269.1 uncharacterized protein LOC124777046 [Schistocerca piceifrons]XP_049947352.1 uncharacterized protein LOC126455629 [Schistocerca serialis cubense]
MDEPMLSDLDKALHELGMLSTVTDSSKEYAKEKAQRRDSTNRQALNVLHMNTRYVTGVIIGSRKGPSFRYKPYPVPSFGREERVRTRSENSDSDLDLLRSTTPIISSTATISSNLFKSRSLESLKVAGSEEDLATSVRDLESVSNKIQYLQVTE